MKTVKDFVPENEGWLVNEIKEVSEQPCVVEPIKTAIGDVEVIIYPHSLRVDTVIEAKYPLAGNEAEQAQAFAKRRWSKLMSNIVAWRHPMLAMGPGFTCIEALDVESATHFMGKILVAFAENPFDLKKGWPACFGISENVPNEQATLTPSEPTPTL